MIPGVGRSPGEGNSYPLQCSCLDFFSRDLEIWNLEIPDLGFFFLLLIRQGSNQRADLISLIFMNFKEILELCQDRRILACLFPNNFYFLCDLYSVWKRCGFGMCVYINLFRFLGTTVR